MAFVCSDPVYFTSRQCTINSYSIIDISSELMESESTFKTLLCILDDKSKYWRVNITDEFDYLIIIEWNDRSDSWYHGPSGKSLTPDQMSLPQFLAYIRWYREKLLGI